MREFGQLLAGINDLSKYEVRTSIWSISCPQRKILLISRRLRRALLHSRHLAVCQDSGLYKTTAAHKNWKDRFVPRTRRHVQTLIKEARLEHHRAEERFCMALSI